jgi:hypothetical protein
MGKPRRQFRAFATAETLTALPTVAELSSGVLE